PARTSHRPERKSAKWLESRKSLRQVGEKGRHDGSFQRRRSNPSRSSVPRPTCMTCSQPLGGKGTVWGVRVTVSIAGRRSAARGQMPCGGAKVCRMFEDFKRKQVAVGDVEIACVVGGEGPPVLLLHGYPQTHAMWARVAPILAERYTVVCAD